MIRSEFVVFGANHYEVDGNTGLSVRVLGNKDKTDFKFGINIVDAAVPYDELNYLKSFSDEFPARFSANVEMTSIKNRSGKDVAGLQLSKLEFVKKVDIK